MTLVWTRPRRPEPDLAPFVALLLEADPVTRAGWERAALARAARRWGTARLVWRRGEGA